MNDKTKHRIVGIVVIAAFLVILIPALMQNTVEQDSSFAGDGRETSESQKTETLESPQSTEPENFQTTPVAQVSLDQSSSENLSQVSQLSEEQPSVEQTTNSTSAEAPLESAAQPVPEAMMEKASVVEPQQESKPVVSPPPQATVARKKVVVPPPQPKPVNQVQKVKPVATVQQKSVNQKLVHVCFQLGTFANANNVQSLLNRLKAQGFSAVKAVPFTLSSGQKVQRVSLCQMMSSAQVISVRSKLTQLVGTAPLVTR